MIKHNKGLTIFIATDLYRLMSLPRYVLPKDPNPSMSSSILNLLPNRFMCVVLCSEWYISDESLVLFLANSSSFLGNDLLTTLRISALVDSLFASMPGDYPHVSSVDWVFPAGEGFLSFFWRPILILFVDFLCFFFDLGYFSWDS